MSDGPKGLLVIEAGMPDFDERLKLLHKALGMTDDTRLAEIRAQNTKALSQLKEWSIPPDKKHIAIRDLLAIIDAKDREIAELGERLKRMYESRDAWLRAETELLGNLKWQKKAKENT